jgi:hypothetical protein
VTSLLYVVALNEYNMMLREDESVVRIMPVAQPRHVGRPLADPAYAYAPLAPCCARMVPSLSLLTQNRLREALVLYHSIITSTYFREIPVILFLNKADLLRRKCRSGDTAQLITAYFPEFAIAPNPGGREADPADWKQVFRFIERMFLESHLGPDVKDEKTRQKQIYAHMVRAPYLGWRQGKRTQRWKLTPAAVLCARAVHGRRCRQHEDDPQQCQRYRPAGQPRRGGECPVSARARAVFHPFRDSIAEATCWPGASKLMLISMPSCLAGHHKQGLM